MLLNNISASGDPDVLVPGGFSGLSKCTFYASIHEVEGGAVRGFPRLADLVGQDEYWCVKGSFLGPEAFSPIEHSLPHDAHAGSFEGFF